MSTCLCGQHLIDVFYCFKHSAKHWEMFAQVHQDFDRIQTARVLKHSTTRWLSVRRCLKRYLEQWDALYAFINHQKMLDKFPVKDRVSVSLGFLNPSTRGGLSTASILYLWRQLVHDSAPQEMDSLLTELQEYKSLPDINIPSTANQGNMLGQTISGQNFPVCLILKIRCCQDSPVLEHWPR